MGTARVCECGSARAGMGSHSLRAPQESAGSYRTMSQERYFRPGRGAVLLLTAVLGCTTPSPPPEPCVSCDSPRPSGDPSRHSFPSELPAPTASPKAPPVTTLPQAKD